MNAQDDAIWERIHRVPFVVQIPKIERDKDLDAKLHEELPGILAWAVRGCLAWQQDKDLRVPHRVTQATQELRADMDDLATFLEECCLLGDPAYVKVQATRFTATYQAWCKRTGNPPLDNRQIIIALEQREFTRVRGTANQYYWLGLGLLSTEERHQDAEQENNE